MPKSKDENSAQVLSCQLKFVHASSEEEMMAVEK